MGTAYRRIHDSVALSRGGSLAAWNRASDVGARIRELRLHLKLSQAKFASLIGVSDQTVSDWESERSAPPRSRLRGIAERVNGSLSMFEEGGPRPKAVVRWRPPPAQAIVAEPAVAYARAGNDGGGRGPMPPELITHELDRVILELRRVVSFLAELRANIPAAPPISPPPAPDSDDAAAKLRRIEEIQSGREVQPPGPEQRAEGGRG